LQRKNEVEASERNVVLVTDFGERDSYVFEMIAALRVKCPAVNVVTAPNLIQAGDIRECAYVVGRIALHLKAGDVLLAVVDPGVGSNRQAVAVRSAGVFLVGPDNGVFSRALDWQYGFEVRVLDKKDMDIRSLSSTFHGRDLFAPVAGLIISGRDFSTIGRSGRLTNTCQPARPFTVGNQTFGHIVHIDCFGNLITDLPAAAGGIVRLNDVRLNQVRCYTEIPARNAGWLVGSDEAIEIAVNGGRADRLLSAEIGNIVIWKAGAESLQ
jgi:S-adenosyl-L-methionine hydrolase (adenosine-forming)